MTRAQLKFTVKQIRFALAQRRRVVYGDFRLKDVKIQGLELWGMLDGLAAPENWVLLDPTLVMAQVTPPSAAPLRTQIEYRCQLPPAKAGRLAAELSRPRLQGD